jgi:hypothetical protein
VELLPGGSLETLPRFLMERRDYYDCLLASDAELVQRLRQYLRCAEKATPAA